MGNPLEDVMGGIQTAFGMDPGPKPQVTTVQTDPATQGLLNKQIDKASQSASSFADPMNKGVDQGAAALSGIPSNQEALHGLPDGTYNALRMAYAGQAQKGIDMLKKQNAYNGEMAKADYMQKTAHTLMQQQQIATNQMQTITQSYIQNEQQRAQAINSLFQLGNTAMGMYAGGAFSGNAKPNRGIDLGQNLNAGMAQGGMSEFGGNYQNS